jgi:hypothetical protein
MQLVLRLARVEVREEIQLLLEQLEWLSQSSVAVADRNNLSRIKCYRTCLMEIALIRV